MRKMMMNENLLSTLKDSPLFNLSLSSKELFHSNFLWWLGNNERTFPLFKQVMESFVGKTLEWSFHSVCVEREKKHFDLCVWNKEKQQPLLILENKVKSIPNKKQLDGYQDAEPQAEHYVLLSLAIDFPDKKKVENDGHWKICSYAHLAEALTVPESLTDYERELIRDYRRFIQTLHELAQQWIGEVTPDKHFIEKRPDGVEDSRLHDLYDKLRFSQLALMLQKRLEALDGLQQGYPKIAVSSGYTNRSGILDVDIDFNRKDYNLMIQVQGKDYRHACVWRSPEQKDCKKLWEQTIKKDTIARTNFLSHEESAKFGDEALFNKGIYPICNSKKKEKEYNMFVGKDYVFLYQSRKIHSEVTIGQLLDNIYMEVEAICSIKD